MRDFKSMKRQRGRNRSGGPGGGGSGKPQQNANRAFESNGPDNLKIRGHAQHVYEKYQQLARDAMSAGDRVLGENFLQHAEHYFRLIRTLQPNRPYTDIVSREGFASGYDIDFEDEGGEGGEEQEQAAENEGASAEDRGDYRDQQPRQDRWEARNGEVRQDQGRADQPRQDRGGYGGGRNNNTAPNGGGNRDRSFNRDQQPRQDRWEARNGEGSNDRSQGDRNQNERSQGDRSQNGRYPGERFDGNRTDAGDERRADRQDGVEQNRDQPRGDGYGRRERGAYGERNGQGRDPLPVVEPQATPLTAQASTAAALQPAPERAGSEAAPAASPARTRVLRSHDGEESHAPAFLQAAAPTPAAEADAPAKRPRGRPKKVKDEAPAE